MSALSALVRRGLRSAWERRWLFAVPVATFLLPAAVWVVHLPDTYRASALVSVRQVIAARPGGALPTTQEWRPEQILATARDRVLQTPNVAAVVPLLWPKGNPTDTYTLNAVRGKVLYDQVGDTRFAVSLEHPDPALAAEAVNALLDAFLHNEREQKVRVAEGQREFLEGEARRAREGYDRALDAMEAFRKDHADTMPDQKDSITAELHRIEQEVRERENDAQRSRMLVPEVDKMLRTTVPSGTAGGAPPTPDEVVAQLKVTSAQAALDQAKKTLAELRLRYTEKNDAVKSAVLQVSLLEKDVDTAKVGLEAARRRADADAASRRRTDSEGLLAYLRQWRESLLGEEERARAAVTELRARSERLAARLAEIPSTDDQLRKLKPALESAYQASLRAEDAARNARAAAEFLRNGDTGDTIGFTLESRAVPPVQPSGPGRMRYLATAVAFGLALGYGLHVLRRRYVDDDLVASPADIADLVPGALVVAVPLVGEGPAPRRGVVVDWACAAWVALCLGGALFALGAHKGWVEAPAWFRPWLGGRA